MPTACNFCRAVPARDVIVFMSKPGLRFSACRECFRRPHAVLLAILEHGGRPPD